MRYEHNLATGEVTEHEDAPTTQPSASTLQATINATHLAYLASTDWMVLRQADSGEVMPNNIKDARAAARLEIKP
jgi:hypothetical protein